MSTSQRIGKLERAIRTRARNELTDEVYSRFEPALQFAANDDGITKHLKSLRDGVIKSRRAEHENQALEAFLAAKDPVRPALTIEQALHPRAFRLDASGKRLADDSTEEHVAVLYPGYTETHDLLIDARAPVEIAEIRHASEIVGDIELLGEKIGLLDDLQLGLTIDRRFREPAVNPAHYPKTPTSRWYVTRSPLIEKSGKPNPSGFVWGVSLYYGCVSLLNPSLLGFVRGGRLVPASQF